MSQQITGLAYDARFLAHDTGPSHPERPERLTAALSKLESLPWAGELVRVAPRAAGLDRIEALHSSRYVERARETCQSGNRLLDTPDVVVSEASFEAALLAAGAALELADAVMAGKLSNGFALLRPPGHHAERDFAMGFCLFNNAAVAARHLQKKHGLERILLLDWDVHHGNGTQHLFEEDPSVLYVSLHQYPYYPGTGASWETGVGKGKGATMNCPMKAGAGDDEYKQAFTEKILPKAEEFRPDAVIVSAGFDAHALDPLGGIRLSTEMYGWMTERVLEIAAKHAKGRVISLLEGGYDLDALADSVATHVAALSGNELYG